MVSSSMDSLEELLFSDKRPCVLWVSMLIKSRTGYVSGVPGERKDKEDQSAPTYS